MNVEVGKMGWEPAVVEVGKTGWGLVVVEAGDGRLEPFCSVPRALLVSGLMDRSCAVDPPHPPQDART